MNELLLLVVIFAAIYLFKKLNYKDVSYVQSETDGNEYLVLNETDMDAAADLLGKVKKNIDVLIEHLKKNDNGKYSPYADQLIQRINGVVLTENSPGGTYTSYTVNKGEEISLCLRNTKKELHDINIIMYVSIHELSHVACPEQNHTDLFKEIFVFLLTESAKIKIYKPVNYNINPHDYCGMTITENLL